MSYTELNDEAIIELSIDFVKNNQVLPQEIANRLEKLGLKDIILAPLGDSDD